MFFWHFWFSPHDPQKSSSQLQTECSIWTEHSTGHNSLLSDLLLTPLYHHIHPSYLSLISRLHPWGRPALPNRYEPSFTAEEIPQDTCCCVHWQMSEAGCSKICSVYTEAARIQHSCTDKQESEAPQLYFSFLLFSFSLLLLQSGPRS